MSQHTGDRPTTLSAVVRLARETAEIHAQNDLDGPYSYGWFDHPLETQRKGRKSWVIVDRASQTYVLTTINDSSGKLAQQIVDLFNSIERWREVNALDELDTWGGEPTPEEWRAMTERKKWAEARGDVREIVHAAEIISRVEELFVPQEGPYSVEKRFGRSPKLLYGHEPVAEMRDSLLAPRLAALLNAQRP